MTAISVGLPGSGATYSVFGDQRDFNAAVGFLNGLTPPGGTINVWPGIYKPTGEYIANGTNIEIIFEPGAIIQVQAGQTLYFGANHSGGGLAWVAVFLLAGARNIIIRNLQIQNLYVAPPPAPNGTINAVVVGGGVFNCKIYNAYADSVTRWARYHTGYYRTSTATGSQTFDGGIHGLEWFAPKSVGCGRNIIPDGGGSKFYNGSSSEYVEDITEYFPEDLDCQFTSWDLYAESKVNNGKPCRNIERFGGHAVFTTVGLKPCRAIYLEWVPPPGTESIRIWGGKYDGQAISNGNIGLGVGAPSREISIVGTEFWNFSVGWEVVGLPTFPCVGGTISLAHLKSYRCGTGGSIVLGAADPGTTLNGLHIHDCIVDDQGAGVTTTGLKITASPDTPLIDFVLERCDFSKVAPGGSAITNTSNGPSFPDARWRDVRGLTDSGLIPTPFGLASAPANEIRNSGATGYPAPSTAYRMCIRNPTLSSTGGGAGISITVYHPDGSVLGRLDPVGSSGSPNTLTWYLLTAAATVSSTGGASSTGSPLSIVAIGPNGDVLVNGLSAFSGITLPSGSYITWGEFPLSTPPSVTVAGTATPFSLYQFLPSLILTQFLWGTSINFGPFPIGTPPTVSVSEGGTNIVNPFISYRDLSVMGSNSAPGKNTTAIPIVYEVRATAVYIGCTSGIGANISIFDSQNNILLNALPTPALVRVDPGYRVAFNWTGSGAPTVVVVQSPE
jgi:hypothetical protein